MDDDTHSVDAISTGDWEAVLERFTSDMDPWAVDIVTLADRYKSYIERLERYDLEVPGRVILIGAILLRMKAEVLREIHGDGDADTEEDAPEEEWRPPEEELEAVDEPQLRIPEAVPEPPVKKPGRRKVTLDELKEALDDALQIKEQRASRQEERRTADDYGIDVEEEDITDRLDSLYSSLKAFISDRTRDALTFSQLVDREERHDRIDAFVNLMHLETEERVRCRQEEFLGEIEIEVLEDADSSQAA